MGPLKTSPASPTASARRSIIALPPAQKSRKSMSALSTDEKQPSAVFDKEILSTNLRNEGKDSHIFNLSLNVPSKIDTEMSMKSLYNFQHLCDGSHSHIYFAETDGHFLEKDVLESIIREADLSPSFFACGGLKGKQEKVGNSKPTIDIIVKRITNKSGEISRALQDFQLELDILSRVRHPHIIKIIGAGKDYDKNTHNYILDYVNLSDIDEPEQNSATRYYPFLLLEKLGGGSLGNYLSKKRSFHSKPFSPSILLEYVNQFIDAVDFLHYGFDKNCSIIHRDLKPDNIGFTARRQLKILDFGLSIIIKRGDNENGKFQMTGNTGTLRYMAPEVARNQPYNEKADMYSFALIVYQMMTGVVPYGGNMPKAQFMKLVVDGSHRPPMDVDDFGRVVQGPKKLHSLLEQCWHDDPTVRMSSTRAKVICKKIIDDFNESSSCALA